MPDSQSHRDHSIEVVVKGIDGEALVLQTPNNDLIHWPLNQLPSTLPFEKKLILKLQPTDETESSTTSSIKGYVISGKNIPTPPFAANTPNQTEKHTEGSPSVSTTTSKEKLSEITNAHTPSITPKTEDTKHARLRKLLENLING